MMQCQNCGQINTATTNFCRFCGTRFPPAQFSGGGNYEFEPPRPYAWKTDELKIADSRARKSKQINQVQPLDNFINNHSAKPQPLAYRQPHNMAHTQICPRCANQQMPRFERKVSTAGWIVFAVLMVVFFPLFWIGLLIKEDVRFCSVCNLRLN
jgi:RNA polymerase subunit RPABC4/transcription elongation factor Spt4